MSDNSWGISRLLAFSQRAPGLNSGNLPFVIAGVRFAPTGVGDVSLHPGDPLWLAFQLWSKPRAGSAGSSTEHPAHQAKLTYSFGRLEGGQLPVTDTEEVDLSNVDAAGDLLTGHQIATAGLDQGTYRLVVTATDDEAHSKAYSTMSFRIVPWSQPTNILDSA